MNLVIKLALRNVLRQKQRNGLLALAIAVGIAVYLLATGFSYGISDILLNKFMALISGHIEIAVQERTEKTRDVIRDKHYFFKAITHNLANVKKVYESIQSWGRIVGNNAGENVIFTGLSADDISGSVFKVKQGSMALFKTPNALADSGYRPIVLYEQIAQGLHVNVGDIVRTKFQRISGQMESQTYEVVAILHKANVFANFSVYVRREELKRALGYAPHETKKIQLLLEDPKQAKEAATLLFESLAPRPAIFASAKNEVRVLDRIEKSPFSDEGLDWKNQMGVILADKSSSYRIGSDYPFVYRSRFEGKKRIMTKVIGLQKDYLGSIFITPRLYEEKIVRSPPSFLETKRSEDIPLLKEYHLLERSQTAQDIVLKYAKLNKNKTKGMVVDIRTMYETGSDILKIENAINGLSVFALMVIMVIILVGVTNTMRMSIRERTREIGTMRAIGMGRPEVTLIFLTEIFLVVSVSCLAGLGLYMIFSHLLSIPKMEGGSSLDMFLLDGHLHFVMHPLTGWLSGAAVIGSTLGIAYLSARKASGLLPAQALRDQRN